MMDWDDRGWHTTSASWLPMTLMMVLCVALIAVAFWAVWAVWLRDRRTPSVASGSGPTARVLLDRRYAAGEIDDAEYSRRRRTLEGDTPPPA